uniref:Inhibitor of growth protein n=1 Tax=Anopheles coluzzii TaxID=1518534 RepID=A0A8W7PR29_ANOCL
MLYLEDYLEMIEHLPQELRDRFTEMREMDLAVQNNTDALDKRVRALFQQCRRAEISSPMADVEFDSIRTNYYRVLDDSDEKIQLAGQMYDLVERYLRRLDTELDKFKCELEADHNGITEILEKRSLELDSMTSNGGANQKENRGSTGGTAGTSGTSSSTTTTTSAAAAEPAASVDQAPEGEWFDPNEPRYCLCNQVSYGDMVACDNEDCPFEWFHYPCVNISSSPKGKWYCPQCSSSMKRRASRKN